MKKVFAILLIAIMFGSMVTAVSAADPVVYFSFNESAKADKGAEAEVIDVELTDGIAGKAGSFNGTTSTVEVTTSYDSLTKGTITVWVKTEALRDYNSVLSGPWESTYVHFNIVIDGLVEIGISDASWTDRKSITPVNDGEWHHIAIAFNTDEGEMNVYIDGELDNEWFPIVSDVNLSAFSIGSWNADRYLDGLIDELYIFDSMLSASEIKDLADVEKINTVDEPEIIEEETVEAPTTPAAVTETPVATAPVVTSSPQTSDAGSVFALITLVMSTGTAIIVKKRK